MGLGITPASRRRRCSACCVCSGSGGEGTVRTAIELLVEYARRRPAETSTVAHVLEEDFGFRHTSYAIGYAAERAVIDALWDLARGGADELASLLFVHVVSRFLRTQFQSSGSKGERSIVIRRFDLVRRPSCSLCGLRCGSGFVALDAVPALRRPVIEVLQHYARSGYEVAQSGDPGGGRTGRGARCCRLRSTPPRTRKGLPRSICSTTWSGMGLRSSRPSASACAGHRTLWLRRCSLTRRSGSSSGTRRRPAWGRAVQRCRLGSERHRSGRAPGPMR